MQDIYTYLKDRDISFQKHEHPAVFTVEQANSFDLKIDAGHSKNLFLRNKNGTVYYLVVVQSHLRIDLKNLAKTLGESRLSFGSPEKMLELLGLTPGSVSPFGLINDENHEVQVIIDNGLIKNERVGFHPNINTATLVISSEDFKKYLENTGNTIRFFSF